MPTSPSGDVQAAELDDSHLARDKVVVPNRQSNSDAAEKSDPIKVIDFCLEVVSDVGKIFEITVSLVLFFKISASCISKQAM